MLFGLIKEKCFYCRTPIEKGDEHKGTVKVPGYTGTFTKSFCSQEHLEQYKEEIKNRPKKSCCG